MKRNGFTLIELLVVVAIIGILAAVGVVAYSGYTSSAKKNAVKANHKNVVKYIMTETMKCTTGQAFAMNDNLDCSKQSLRNWKDFVAKAVEIALKDFKNPYDNDPSKKTVSHGGNITNDTDVGYIRMRSPGTAIEVNACFITPCAGTRCTSDNHICSGDINLN
tara:strand:- start:245 stop:733 length:489 start_codon:yes stop_codon:yes gene_type:complete